MIVLPRLPSRCTDQAASVPVRVAWRPGSGALLFFNVCRQLCTAAARDHCCKLPPPDPRPAAFDDPFVPARGDSTNGKTQRMGLGTSENLESPLGSRRSESSVPFVPPRRFSQDLRSSAQNAPVAVSCALLHHYVPQQCRPRTAEPVRGAPRALLPQLCATCTALTTSCSHNSVSTATWCIPVDDSATFASKEDEEECQRSLQCLLATGLIEADSEGSEDLI